MKRELIDELFGKFELAKRLIEGFECWSARDLQVHLGYTEWRNFVKVIEKAQSACENSGGVVADHFVDLNKMVADVSYCRACKISLLGRRLDYSSFCWYQPFFIGV